MLFSPTSSPSISPTIGSIITLAPSTSPTTEANIYDNKDNESVLQSLTNILIYIIFGVLVVIQILALSVRRTHRHKLNSLRKYYEELFEIILKSGNISIFINILLFKSDNYENLNVASAYNYIIVSGVVRVCVWLIYVILLFIPQTNFYCVKIRLNTLLYKPILLHPIFVLVLMIAACDVTFIRLLPWTNTLFSSMVNGYPNMLTVRFSIYGSAAANILQSVASCILLIANGSLIHYIFAVVSILNSIRSMLYLLFFLQVSRSYKLNLLFLHRDDAAILAILQNENPTSDIETLRESFVRTVTPMDVRHLFDNLFGKPDEITVRNSNSTTLNVMREESKEGFGEEERDFNDVGAIVHQVSVDGMEIVNFTPPEYIVDDRGIRVSEEYLDKTVDILRKQVMKSGVKPLAYIPLQNLKEEIAFLCRKATSGEKYDEQRLDYLISCLSVNPEYEEEQLQESIKWRNEIHPFSSECLQIMRSYIPPSIFYESLNTLVNTYNIPKSLASRIMNKKCLWLIRISKEDIQKIHIAEFLGRFNTSGQNLDIVELAAIYACLPNSLHNDHDGKKKIWKANIEENLKSLYIQKNNNTIRKDKLRNNAYANVVGLFGDRTSLHSTEVFNSSENNNPSNLL